MVFWQYSLVKVHALPSITTNPNVVSVRPRVTLARRVVSVSVCRSCCMGSAGDNIPHRRRTVKPKLCTKNKRKLILHVFATFQKEKSAFIAQNTENQVQKKFLVFVYHVLLSIGADMGDMRGL